MNGVAWGGSEELWYHTALHLAQKAAKVGCAVYAQPEKEERLQKLEAAGCAVYRLPVQTKRKSMPLQKLLDKLRYQKTLRQAMAALPLDEYETVVVNQGGFEVYTTTWQNFYKRLRSYALLFHNYDESHIFSKRQKRALKNWTHGAAVNGFAAAQLHKTVQRQLGFEIPHAVTFVNPITFAPPALPAPFPSLANGPYVFAVFASLDVQRKAQDKLIKILSAEKWKRRSWVLNLYGEGPDKTLLQKLIDQYELQEKIFLKGHTPNVAEALKQTHLVLQLTNIDAMPLSVVEAMAMARPLVVTRLGDMPAWVHDEENGWVCTTDAAAVDAGLEKAWQARKQWEAMGRHSFGIFKERFPRKAEDAFLHLLPQAEP